MATNYYPKSSGSNTYYSSSDSTEPNMRKELINTIDGSFPEIAKGHPVLLRKARLDGDNQPVSCDCVDETTQEPDKTNFCPLCFGHGYYWDEEWISAYSTLETSTDASNAFLNKIIPPGIIDYPSVVFYTRYSDVITTHDRFIEVELNNDGTVVEPVNRLTIFRVNYVWQYRADEGKFEYNKVFSHKENIKYLNKPSFDGTR